MSRKSDAELGRRVREGLEEAWATRRENYAYNLNLRLPILLKEYLEIKLDPYAGRPSEWQIARYLSRRMVKYGLRVGQKQMRRILDMIPGASKTLCYGGSSNYGGLQHDTEHAP